MIPDPNADPIGWLDATAEVGWMLTTTAARRLGVTPARLRYLRRRGETPPRASMKLPNGCILWARQTVGLWDARGERRHAA